MPQMMPMLWVIMISLTMSILLLIIILTHFLNLPTIMSMTHSQKISNYSKWNWLW